MKKTWHTVFLILLICLDAALLLLPLLPGYRALFDIGPYPDRLPAFRFLKLAGYALFFPLTAYGCGRLLARIRTPRLRWLPAAVFALIATALVCLHNNELHMLCRLDSGWVHVPHMYENLVRADLTYRGGLGIFRYVLPWAGTFLLCVLAGTYSLQQFLSLCRKAFAALRRRCLLRHTQARQALPCSLLVLLFLGVPISYAIAVSSLTAILSSIDLNVAVLTAAQRTFVGMSKFSLTAIPFFILAGNIMNQGGIAKRLVDFVMAILGKLPGALLVTNIGTNALFGAISGSASAAAAAVGSMIRDGADEQGYDPAVTAATNAASSCSGLLIPPSNALITYSLASGGTSVAALFMAGYIPGIIWALCCCVVGVLLAVKLGYKGTPGKFDWKNLGVCTLRALPSLSLIIVVIGGIIGGVFSATEGSAIAVVYALVLAFCYRSINLKSLWKIIVDSAKMSGMVVFLVGVSNILGWVMAFLQIPDAVAAALLSLTSNKYIILLIMNVILLVSGTFMDVTPAILIFTPLFLPICQSFGMSTIQFGLILVYNLCIGNITPPVGNALFVGIKVGRTSLSKVMPYMLMYYVAIIGGLLLVTFIPAVSTALPQAMGLM